MTICNIFITLMMRLALFELTELEKKKCLSKFVATDDNICFWFCSQCLFSFFCCTGAVAPNPFQKVFFLFVLSLSAVLFTSTFISIYYVNDRMRVCKCESVVLRSRIEKRGSFFFSTVFFPLKKVFLSVVLFSHFDLRRL